MKRFITILTAIVLMFAMSVSAFAADYHIPYGSSTRCYAVIKYIHVRYVGVYNGAHQLEDGTVCRFTAVRWNHADKCDVCGYYEEYPAYDCQVRHEICDIEDICVATHA